MSSPKYACNSFSVSNKLKMVGSAELYTMFKGFRVQSFRVLLPSTTLGCHWRCGPFVVIATRKLLVWLPATGPGNNIHITWTLISWYFRVSNWTNRNCVPVKNNCRGFPQVKWSWTPAWPWKLFLPLNWVDRMSYFRQESLLWVPNLPAPSRWLQRWILFFLLLSNLPSEVQAMCMSHKHFYKPESKERKTKQLIVPPCPLKHSPAK